jgi:large subunit ribosomal protein L29
MKVAEVREMGSAELHLQLEQLRKHLFDLRAQAVTEKLENPCQLGHVRKDIARVLTVLCERGVTDIEEKQHHLEAVASKGAPAA